MRVVLLISGGVESSTLVRHLRPTHEVIPLFLDYGQRAAAQEWTATQAQCTETGLSPVRLDLASVGDTFRAADDKKYHVPIPHRNLTALALAFSYAVRRQAEAVAISLTADDARDYPSADRRFCEQFADMTRRLDNVALSTPLADMQKADVIRYGVDLGVVFSTTYSCLLGRARHCGRCPQCAKRKAAFQAAGLEEPVDFYENSRA